MLTRDDLIDLLMQHLASAGYGKKAEAAAAVDRWTEAKPKGRLFLSEYDVKKRLARDGQSVPVPRDAILSPLAQEWLTMRRIKIIHE